MPARMVAYAPPAQAAPAPAAVLPGRSRHIAGSLEFMRTPVMMSMRTPQHNVDLNEGCARTGTLAGTRADTEYIIIITPSLNIVASAHWRTAHGARGPVVGMLRRKLDPPPPTTTPDQSPVPPRRLQLFSGDGLHVSRRRVFCRRLLAILGVSASTVLGVIHCLPTPRWAAHWVADDVRGAHDGRRTEAGALPERGGGPLNLHYPEYEVLLPRMVVRRSPQFPALLRRGPGLPPASNNSIYIEREDPTAAMPIPGIASC